MIRAELMDMESMDHITGLAHSVPRFFVLDVDFSPDVAFTLEGSWEQDPADWLMPFIYISVTLPNGEHIDVDPKYNLQDDERTVGPFLAKQLLEHCYITNWKWV